MIRKITFIYCFIFFFNAFSATAAPQHSFAVMGSPKYSADFKHFDYVNPAAPKGGLLKLYALGTFDNLNPFILKGNAVAGSGMPFESLMVNSGDERDVFYGLIAETVEYLPQANTLTFTLRKNARWHDQTPITPEDVVFSYQILAEHGTPSYRNLLKEVEKVTALSENQVQFTFKRSKRRDLPTIAAILPILPKHYYANQPFDKTTLTPPLGSGPYQIQKVDAGSSITYQRVQNYWGADLPVNIGQYNFDTIEIDYYRDPHVALEAFKAGNYDVRIENNAKNWATGYQFPAVTAKKVIRTVLPSETPADLQAIFMNTRRPLFQDKRVREAFTLAFDFEWLNKNIFFNRYKRIQSLFENTDHAAHDVPSVEETTLLLPFYDKLPQEVFKQPFTLPVLNGGGNIRAQLQKSGALLDAAGWSIAKGKRKNSENQILTTEFLIFDPTLNRVYQPYIQNLQKLGIEATLRVVDSTQFHTRVQQFDFDMVSLRFVQSPTPGIEQFYFWGSTSANLPGSPNIAGVQNPIVDVLIERLIHANTSDAIRIAARALDRVILWNYYFIPSWFASDHYLAYWDRFGQPPRHPRYVNMPNQSTFDPVGMLHLWWYDEAKALRLKP